MSGHSAVTTHVLDTARGVPAAGVPVRLEEVSAAGAREVGRAVTGGDGRVPRIGPEQLAAGTYRLVFDTAGYLGEAGPAAARAAAGAGGTRGAAFFPEVTVTFTVSGAPGAGSAHYHVPLLLSPFGYTTYRGS